MEVLNAVIMFHSSTLFAIVPAGWKRSPAVCRIGCIMVVVVAIAQEMKLNMKKVGSRH